MEKVVIEASYPITFREDDAKRLGDKLAHRHSVDLIGMKRVGISNFLRFFLYHRDIVETYISKTDTHLFIPVDLNDLVEREIYPFWALTFKRIIDAGEQSKLPVGKQKSLENAFLKSIQSQDLFMLIDGVRQSLHLFSAQGINPTLFFLRFDRMKDVVTPSFFDNLQGLKDATNGQLAYVFTSFRSLDMLAPDVFTKTSLAVFAQPISLRPAGVEDMRSIYDTYRKSVNLTLSPELEEALFRLVNGHVQYLQLALLILKEKEMSEQITVDELQEVLQRDERILLQSEELWESLHKDEQDVLRKIQRGESISDEEKVKANYLWDNGFVVDREGTLVPFSPLLTYYLAHIGEQEGNDGRNLHFSKKEQLLIDILTAHKNLLCEREMIINAVWPEYQELGVSDWAVDRLVSRVRTKLKQQGTKEEIITIRTRGYKLTTEDHK